MWIRAGNGRVNVRGVLLLLPFVGVSLVVAGVLGWNLIGWLGATGAVLGVCGVVVWAIFGPLSRETPDECPSDD